MEEPGLQKQLTNQDLIKIIEHLESICSQCTDTTKTKSFACWIIDSDIYWIFACLIGEKVRTLKPEERINGYTVDKD